MKTFKQLIIEDHFGEKSEVEKKLKDHLSNRPNDRVVKMLVPGEQPSKIHVFVIDDQSGKKTEIGSYVRIGK